MSFSTSSFKRYLILLGILWLLFCASVMTANYLIDPLYRFHAPPQKGYFARGARERNAGLVLNKPVEAALMGTSMSENFDPAHFKARFGAEITHLAMAGSSAYEQSIVMQRLLSAQKPKMIFWELYPTTFTGENNRLNPTVTFADFLYRDDPLSVLRYLIDLDTTLHSLHKTLTKLGLRPKSDPDTINQWFHREEFSQSRVIDSICHSARATSRQRSVEYNTEQAVSNFETLVAPLVLAHREVRFVFFVPPVSYAFFLNATETEQADYLTLKNALLAAAQQHENVSTYDFEALDHIRGDLNNYKDAGHYSEKINRLMVEMMATGAIPPFDEKLHYEGVKRVRGLIQSHCPGL